jgi:hypothetical protein
LARIFWARLAVWGVVTVTVNAGLLATGDLTGSAAQTMPTAATHKPRTVHIPTPVFFMSFLFSIRHTSASEV